MADQYMFPYSAELLKNKINLIENVKHYLKK